MRLEKCVHVRIKTAAIFSIISLKSQQQVQWDLNRYKLLAISGER